MKTRIITCFLVWIVGLTALGHPTSFQGGTAFLFSQSESEVAWQLHYSYRYWGSFGFEKQNWISHQPEHQREIEILRANFLVQRFHQPDSQGNIYFNFGAGQERHQGDTDPLQLVEVQADWESRQIYTMAAHTKWLRPAHQDIELTKFRLGFAPYLGEFNDLSTWLIFEGTRKTLAADELTTFLRFYHRNVLWELGSSQNGQVKMNFMIHY